MMKFSATVALVSMATAAPAFAQTFSGDTTGAPTWNRPVENGNAVPTPPPSLVGTNVNYQVFAFTVSLTGTYSFTSTAVNGWDNYTFMYQNAFDPNDVFTNVMIGNDDLGLIGVSGFSVALSTGTTYHFVVTGFNNGDAGAFNVEASNTEGGVISIPTPGAAALIGLGGLAATHRRR